MLQRVENHTLCKIPTTFSVQKCATKTRSTDSQTILASYDSKFSCQYNENRKGIKRLSTRFCAIMSRPVHHGPTTGVLRSSHFCVWAAIGISCLIRIKSKTKYKTYIRMFLTLKCWLHSKSGMCLTSLNQICWLLSRFSSYLFCITHLLVANAWQLRIHHEHFIWSESTWGYGVACLLPTLIMNNFIKNDEQK